jgi:hypothetical protein
MAIVLARSGYSAVVVRVLPKPSRRASCRD